MRHLLLMPLWLQKNVHIKFEGMLPIDVYFVSIFSIKALLSLSCILLDLILYLKNKSPPHVTNYCIGLIINIYNFNDTKNDRITRNPNMLGWGSTVMRANLTISIALCSPVWTPLIEPLWDSSTCCWNTYDDMVMSMIWGYKWFTDLVDAEICQPQSQSAGDDAHQQQSDWDHAVIIARVEEEWWAWCYDGDNTQGEADRLETESQQSCVFQRHAFQEDRI